MARYYPDPVITTFIDLLLYNNIVTDNMFGIITLFSIFMIVFISLKKYPFEHSFSVASFVAAIVSYLISIMGLLGSHLVLIPTVMFLCSIFLLFRKR